MEKRKTTEVIIRFERHLDEIEQEDLERLIEDRFHPVEKIVFIRKTQPTKGE